MRYLYLHVAGSFQYPKPGNWEDQPVWFDKLLQTGISRHNQNEKDSIEKMSKKGRK